MNRTFIYVLMLSIITNLTASAQEKIAGTSESYTKKEIPVKEIRISDSRNVIASIGYFYDAGGKDEPAGSKYFITTLHAPVNCIEIYFEEFSIPAGARLNIYLGKDQTGPLLGSFGSKDKIFNIKGPNITFEYFPSISKDKSVAPGWKAKISPTICGNKSPKVTWPESDCPYAIPLCGNSTVVTSVNQYTDLGVINDDGGSCYGGTGSGGSVWYSFWPTSNGPLDFKIQPTGNTDYDFVLWDITAGCATGQRQEISCNYSLYTLATGLSDVHCNDNVGTNAGGCTTDSKPSDDNTWNRRVNVLSTHQYAICVNFYSGTNDGFTLTFTNEAGSVGVTDNILPTITNTAPNSCTSASTIHLDFSEWMDCATIGNDPNEFFIPGYTITVSNMNCVNGRTMHVDLLVTPPLPAGTYTLTVTNISDMCGNVMNQTWPINIGTPIADAGPDKYICQSRTINIFGGYDYSYNPNPTILTASGGGSYAWSNGASTQTTTVNPTTTTTYTLTASIGTCTATDYTNVIVEGANAGPDRSVCTGQSTTLTAQTSLTYHWYSNPNALFGTNGTSIGTTQSIIVNPTTNTTYRVIVTTANGCTSTWDLKVTVLTTNVPVSVSTSICPGSGSSVLSSSGYDTYTWNPGGLNGASVSVTPGTTTNYSVTATALSGCSGSNTVTVYVNPNPTATAAATPDPICQGGNLNLSTVSPNTITLFSEDFEAGNKLLVKNAPNCGLFLGNSSKWIRNTASTCNGTYALFISIDNSTWDYDICNSVSFAYFDLTIPSCYTNVNLSFNYKVTGKAGDDLQIWNCGLQYVPVVNTVTDTTGGNVKLGGNLYNVPSCTPASFNLSAYAGQSRRIVFQWRNAGGLFASPNPPPALIDDILVTATPGYTYSWSSNPGGFTSTLQNPIANPSANTTYTVTVTRCDGCSTTATTSITVSPISITAVASNPSICPGDSSVLTAGGAGTYTWNPGGMTGSTVTVFPGSTTIYTVSGDNGSCSATQTVTVNVGGVSNANITSTGPYCSGLAAFNLSAVSPGGTWSGTGITNPSAGTFDPGLAGPGQHQIIYTISGACGAADTAMITVQTSYDATINPPGPFCTSASPLNLTAADPGGTWSGAGITNSTLGTFNPSVAGAGTHQVVYQISGACGDSDTILLTVANSYNATITPAGPFCSSSAPYNLTAANTGGTWSGTGVNPATGVFSPSVAGVGTFNIVYTISGACGDDDTISITVNQAQNATINPAGPFCTNASPVNLTAASSGGVWSGTGITNSSLGTFNPSVAGAGTFTITYGIAGACGDTATTTITVNQLANATITAAGPFCSDDVPYTLIAANTGGTWSGTGVNAATGIFSPSVSGAGTFNIIYTISGACGDDDTLSIQVNPAANATINAAGPYCVSDTTATLTAAQSGGSWSGTGITNTTNGTFNPSLAGVGTHQIIYAITGACGDADTITVNVVTQANATINPAGPFCANIPATNLTAITSGGTWSGTGITNITNGTFDPGTAGQGNHTITYTIGGLCGDVDTAIIKVVAAPMLAVNGIAVSCEGATDGSASATAGGGTTPYVFHWDNNANTQNISDLAPGSYLVVVTDDNGCQDARTVTIDGSTEPCEIIVPVLYVPNIFTPNGDGENDILYVRGKGVESLEFVIYDRWGEKIFESAYSPQGDDRVSIGWDGTFHGKPVISDVYAWHLKAVMIDDKTYNWKGSITLVR